MKLRLPYILSCDVQEIKRYLVQWIKLVEKLDEGAFHRKHMFQVVIVPSGPLVPEEESGQTTLYLQAGVSGWVVGGARRSDHHLFSHCDQPFCQLAAEGIIIIMCILYVSHTYCAHSAHVYVV